MDDLYDQLYQAMCKNCPGAHRCHNLCEECDEFQDELEQLEKEKANAKTKTNQL